MEVAVTVEEVTLAAGIWVAVTWAVAAIHIMVVVAWIGLVTQDSMDPISADTINQV